MKDRSKSRAARAVAVLAAVILITAAAFGVYVGDYYRAEPSVSDILTSDSGPVQVCETQYGWFLDGPSTENAMVFYPGAKVDEKAYIPLLYRFAESGMDVCLVKMPFHLAIFGMNEASGVMAQYDYANWYIGGHSLGGAMGANYACGHADELRGVVLLAAYATKELDDDLVEVVLYGSEDEVLTDGKIEEGRAYAPGLPGHYLEHVIEGGNHAQFGNYGEQKGDGKALISAEEQQAETVRVVMEAVE